MNKNIEIIYKNIDNITEEKFYKYLKPIPIKLKEEFNHDLFYNKGLVRFLDIEKILSCLKVVYKI